MYLIFDTETTGLPKDKKAALSDYDNWPRIVQLAASLYDKDRNLVGYMNRLIKPDGWVIHENAFRVHGISQDHAEKNGSEIKIALLEFSALANQAHFLIAHSVDFDWPILGSELLRANIDLRSIEKPTICTMTESIGFCGIPGPEGLKKPRLSELHDRLFNEAISHAHEAGADVAAASRCFFGLMDLHIIGQPQYSNLIRS